MLSPNSVTHIAQRLLLYTPSVCHFNVYITPLVMISLALKSLNTIPRLFLLLNQSQHPVVLTQVFSQRSSAHRIQPTRMEQAISLPSPLDCTASSYDHGIYYQGHYGDITIP